MNRSFDRFTRILKPVQVLEIEHDSTVKCVPVTGRKFSANGTGVKYFDNEEECIKRFNGLIDQGTSQYNGKLVQMQHKLNEMLSLKYENKKRD